MKVGNPSQTSSLKCLQLTYVLKKTNKSPVSMFSAEPEVPFNKPLCVFQCLFSHVSSETINLFFKCPPVCFHVLSMCSCDWMNKEPLMIYLIMYTTMLSQTMVGMPGITQNCTCRSDILLNYRC